MGKDWIKYPSIKANTIEKNIDLIMLLILLSIIKEIKDITKPIEKIKWKLKFFISNPCKVAKIFHIETKLNKNKDEIIQ